MAPCAHSKSFVSNQQATFFFPKPEEDMPYYLGCIYHCIEKGPFGRLCFQSGAVFYLPLHFFAPIQLPVKKNLPLEKKMAEGVDAPHFLSKNCFHVVPIWGEEKRSIPQRCHIDPLVDKKIFVLKTPFFSDMRYFFKEKAFPSFFFGLLF